MLENIPTAATKNISTPSALGGVVLGVGMTVFVLTGSAGAIVAPTGIVPPPRPGNSVPPSARAMAAAPRFAVLADRWVRETTSASSDYEHLIAHPAYLSIVAMGWEAVPFILERLEAAPDHWGAALAAITGDDPVGPDAAGDVYAIADAWLVWGRARNLVT